MKKGKRGPSWRATPPEEAPQSHAKGNRQPLLARWEHRDDLPEEIPPWNTPVDALQNSQMPIPASEGQQPYQGLTSAHARHPWAKGWSRDSKKGLQSLINVGQQAWKRKEGKPTDKIPLDRKSVV